MFSSDGYDLGTSDDSNNDGLEGEFDNLVSKLWIFRKEVGQILESCNENMKDIYPTSESVVEVPWEKHQPPFEKAAGEAMFLGESQVSLSSVR